ncbi:MAG: RNA polymerase sigma factor [Ginsengibacter sp.]
MINELMVHKAEMEKAFENDINEHRLLIHKVCSIYAFTRADRKDLFQEIVIQVWKAYPNFRGAAKISTWMYRVAINTAITALRRQKTFITSYEPAALPVNMIDGNVNDAEEEQRQQLQQAIGRLNEIEKAIVMLYMEDKTYPEMEDIIGISTGALRVKMSRIRAKLRELTKTFDNGNR